MEVAKGIHRIECKFGGNRMVFVHLLIGENASMLVDTGCAHNPDQDILPYMEKIGFDLKNLTYILISHSDIDHQGGNAPMKIAAPQAILACHNLDRPWIESTDALINGRYSQFERDHGIGYGEEGKAGIREGCLSAPVDLTLEGGEQFRLSPDWSVTAIHAPGHSWGHMVVYDPRSKALISGEAAIWKAILTADFQPFMPPTYCYVDTYVSTIDFLLQMDIEMLLPAHWRVQTGQDVGEFLRESKHYCLHVEQKIADYARDHSPFTLRQVVDELGMTLGDWAKELNQDFSYGMSGNLVRLTERGILKTGRNNENLVTWSLA